MTKQEIFEKVAEFLRRQLEMKSNYEIKMENDLVNDLGVDSLDKIELWLAGEEITGLTIPEEDLEEVVTVKDVVEYLYERMERTQKSN